MTVIHGGDIYRNCIKLDFSVNVNPLGTPEAVKTALHAAALLCDRYPDPSVEALKKAVAAMQAVPEESLLFGNGASELFMAIMHGIKPKKTVVPVPSFYGYEHAVEAAGGKVIYYEMRREDGFSLTQDFYSVLTEDVELLFLANPNNPTGKLMHKEEIIRILEYCRDRGIYVALDECFIEFGGSRHSMMSRIGQFEHLILVRAFTKLFAIPGVRLGYLTCSDGGLLRRIERQLPEWNISIFAQEAGRVCAGQTDFVRKAAGYIRKEREFLAKGLAEKGYTVFPSSANFLLIHREENRSGALYDKLLAKGILVRDCGNFRGLGDGYYRIAVRKREENEVLLNEL